MRNVQSCQHKVNGPKDAVLFHQYFCWNFTAYLGLQLLQPAPYFGPFLPNAVAIKNIKNYLRKNCSALVPKILLKLILWHFSNVSDSHSLSWSCLLLWLWLIIFYICPKMEENILLNVNNNWNNRFPLTKSHLMATIQI